MKFFPLTHVHTLNFIPLGRVYFFNESIPPRYRLIPYHSIPLLSFSSSHGLSFSPFPFSAFIPFHFFLFVLFALNRKPDDVAVFIKIYWAACEKKQQQTTEKTWASTFAMVWWAKARATEKIVKRIKMSPCVSPQAEIYDTTLSKWHYYDSRTKSTRAFIFFLPVDGDES